VRVVLLGPPGSGKGTQAKLIKDKFNFAHISTGDILRDAIKKKIPLGLKAKKKVDSGKLVDDDIIINLIKERIKKEDCNKGYILDGFPRTISQAKALEAINNNHKQIIIKIDVNEKEIIKRLSSRMVCENCNAIYNPRDNEVNKRICKLCGGNLVQREDDKPEVIKKRIETYKKHTKPLINYYKNEQKIQEIDGNRKIRKIFEDICDIIQEANDNNQK